MVRNFPRVHKDLDRTRIPVEILRTRLSPKLLLSISSYNSYWAGEPARSSYYTNLYNCYSGGAGRYLFPGFPVAWLAWVGLASV